MVLKTYRWRGCFFNASVRDAAVGLTSRCSQGFSGGGSPGGTFGSVLGGTVECVDLHWLVEGDGFLSLWVQLWGCPRQQSPGIDVQGDLVCV